MKRVYSYFLAAMLFVFAAAQQVMAEDVVFHFYIPAAHGFASESGCAVQWYFDGSEEAQIAPLTAEDGATSWYTFTVTREDYTYTPIYFALLNASSVEAATQVLPYEDEATYGGYFLVGKSADGSFQFYTLSSYYSQYPNDYLPYNLQANQSQDTLYVSWESNSTPSSWRVYVYDANNLGSELSYSYIYENQGFVVLRNSEPMQIVWKVVPSIYYEAQPAFTAYSDPMTIQGSPKVATNIQGTLNADGTYTFSWDAALSPEVKQYWVNIVDPTGSSVYSTSNYLRTTSFTTAIDAMFSGNYTIHVYSYGESTWTQLGEAVGTFAVAPVAPHDITVRFLLGSMSGVDTSAGVQLNLMKTAGNQEVVDATQEQYGWWSYTFNTTERGARVGVKTGYWSSMIDIYGDTCIEYTQNSGYLEVECDARATDYEPHDILATQNEDGTYTISWLMDATERVAHYNVYLYHSMTGQNVLALNEWKATQVQTGALAAGMYNLQISVYEQVPNNWGGYNYYQIGTAYHYFTIEEQPAHDITVRVLPQPGAGEWYAYIYDQESYGYNTQINFVQEEGSPWFTYTFNTTSPAVNVMFKTTQDMWYDREGKVIACQENTCLEFEDDAFKTADCNATLKDYTVSNAQYQDLGNSKMTFTWECATDPAQFKIYLNDENDVTFTALTADGSARSYTGSVLVDSAMATVKWFVVPVTANDTYLWDNRGYGADFSLAASPYVPQNIVATQNADFTWTITWDACPEPVTSYTVYDGIAGYTMWVSGTSYTTSAATSEGTYTVRITPQMSTGETGATRSVSFEVLPVAERSITVRLLKHPYSGGSAQDLYLPDTYNYISPVDEGNGWYSYTFNSTKPGQRIQLYGSQYTVSKDTCFEYITYLTYAACDAVQHDYSIAEGSLQAASVPGKVTFSWSPSVEKATFYQLVMEQYNEEYGYWYSFVYQQVSDTCFTYMVPDDKDGMEVRWYVYPSAPHSLYNQQMYGDNITLHKSVIELTNLQATTTDSVTYHFSWASNTDTVQYEFEIPSSYYGEALYSVVQAGKTQDYTFISGYNPYNWRVRAVNAAGEPLTNWVNGEAVQAKSSLHAISDLQGSISGNTLHYTWSKTSPYVMAFLECQNTDYGYMNVVNDSILSGNSLTVTAEMDGRYVLRLTPAVESAPGKYGYIYEEQICNLNYFSGQTYHIAVSTTTGGVLMDDVTGDYPAGYTLYLRIWEEPGYRFIGWSDGNNDLRRVYTVEEDANLIALFEPVPQYDVTLEATEGGKLLVDYSRIEISRLDTTLYEGNYLYFEVVVEDGYAFYGWSDGYDATQLSRNIAISQDTIVTAVVKPICYVTTSAGVGGRVQVTGGQYDKARKAYKCIYGTELTLKANPDEGYRFAQWNDGNTNVTRTVTVTANMTFSATFVSVETPLNKYTVRVLSSDPELGMVSQISGTYTEGDQLTISAIPAQKANFVQWSDGNTEATRIITVNADITLTATFAIKQLTLTVSASQGGSVNTEVNGIYEYGTMVSLTATPDEHYHFTGWSDGYPYETRTVEMTEDITLTANFAQEQYLVTFLNADGSLIEANRYSAGEMPVCSVTPTLEPTDEWVYSFTGWTPEITAVTGNAVYTAVYSQEPVDHSGFDNVKVMEKAAKVLVNGQIFILRGEHIYTIQGQLVK